MRKVICGGIFLYAVILSFYVAGTLGDPTEKCQPRNTTYKISDSQQCDKYHECTKGGKLLERLCDDGFVFSEEIHACEYPHNVNCSARPDLQETTSINPDCPRMNGFYPFPPAESCQKFYHCLEGKAYEKTCAEGVIFDPKVAACIHPDQVRRPDCAARTVLNFTCPNYGKKFVRMRFGDHDRLPHPTNCRKFYICFSDGRPRVGGCALGKVFNPKQGICDSPKKVPECKDYYGKKDLAKLAKLAELGEEGVLEDDQIHGVDHAEEEDSSTNEAASQDEEQEEQQAPPQPEAPKPKSKGKKFQSRIVKRREGSPAAPPPDGANDNNSPSGKSTIQTKPSQKSSTNKSENNGKTDDEDDNDDED